MSSKNSPRKYNHFCKTDEEGYIPGEHRCAVGDECCVGVYLRKYPKACLILLAVVLILVIILLILYLSTNKQEDTPAVYQETTNSSLTRSSTREPAETFPHQPQMEAIRFNVINSYITSYSGTSSSTLVFRRSGRYNVNLLVVYDEGYCRPHSPPEGKIHLRIVKAADLSKVGKVFSETFSRRPGKKWMVYGRINAQVKMQRGQGLLIDTDHRECIKQTGTHLSVTKLQNQNIT
ncbi:uncharacterized protein LOC117342792 isoform X2 [Pecten maximus]|uniref:uncharacterized protein LOC117342792 isoform X2 n=1 Tax=Pecten maximus TaxID=6579 RepID=UPI0014585616|nr:uncharacterized protein LOC117342792 isoform X2 [Pecten maximus]